MMLRCCSLTKFGEVGFGLFSKRLSVVCSDVAGVSSDSEDLSGTLELLADFVHNPFGLPPECCSAANAYANTNHVLMKHYHDTILSAAKILRIPFLR